jgi:hypothetical protein
MIHHEGGGFEGGGDGGGRVCAYYSVPGQVSLFQWVAEECGKRVTRGDGFGCHPSPWAAGGQGLWPGCGAADYAWAMAWLMVSLLERSSLPDLNLAGECGGARSARRGGEAQVLQNEWKSGSGWGRKFFSGAVTEVWGGASERGLGAGG